jgi:Tol biopolymer transport system component
VIYQGIYLYTLRKAVCPLRPYLQMKAQLVLQRHINWLILSLFLIFPAACGAPAADSEPALAPDHSATTAPAAAITPEPAVLTKEPTRVPSPSPPVEPASTGEAIPASVSPVPLATATTTSAELGGQLALLIGGPPLSLVDLAGGPPRSLGAENLATYGALFFQWSPDGQKMVYSAEADLWLLDAGSGQSHHLTDNDRWDLMPAWSPDGDWIAFASRPLLPEETKTDWMQGAWGGSLAVIRADGRDFRILDDEGNVATPPGWAPTGKRLAYAADGELRLYDLDTDTRAVLAPSAFNLDAAYLDGPAWSPDSRSIAVYFSRSAEFADWEALGAGTAPEVGQGVAVLDLEAGTVRVLFEWEAPFVGAMATLRWQPGGDRLLINVQAAPRVPQHAGLWLADSISSEVTALPAAAYDADWSPDGRWIAAIDLDDRERLVLVDVERLTADPIVSRWPYALEGLAWRPSARDR